MSKEIQVSMPANPTENLEENPKLVKAWKKFLQETGSGDAYAAQHSTSFIVVTEGDELISVRQINPQAAQPMGAQDIDTQNAGNVGSGGYNPANDSPA
jgi:hypothetical protein